MQLNWNEGANILLSTIYKTSREVLFRNKATGYVVPICHSGLEFEPGVNYSENGQDRGREAAGPHKARPRGVQTQPVQRYEHVAQVLQKVQEQRRVVAQHRDQETELLVELGREHREGRQWRHR